jgi:hypothetical protein
VAAGDAVPQAATAAASNSAATAAMLAEGPVRSRRPAGVTTRMMHP